MIATTSGNFLLVKVLAARVRLAQNAEVVTFTESKKSLAQAVGAEERSAVGVNLTHKTKLIERIFNHEIFQRI